MKRKLLSALLAACMLAGLAVPSFAEDTTTPTLKESLSKDLTLIQFTNGNSYFFAGGTPITIDEPAADAENVSKIAVADAGASISWEKDDGTTATINVPKCVDKVGPNIYGGSHGGDKDNPVQLDSTSITMKGGDVRSIFGGGFHACNVTNAEVTMTGGKVMYLNAGGETSGVNDSAQDKGGCTGYQTYSNKREDLEKIIPHNVVETTEVTISGGTVTSVLFGSSASTGKVGTSIVTIEGGTFPTTAGDYCVVSATGSNGFCDNATLNIDGEVEIPVVQAVNRGIAKEITINVKNGTIEKLFAGGETGNSYTGTSPSIVNGEFDHSIVNLYGGTVEAFYPGGYAATNNDVPMEKTNYEKYVAVTIYGDGATNYFKDTKNGGTKDTDWETFATQNKYRAITVTKLTGGTVNVTENDNTSQANEQLYGKVGKTITVTATPDTDYELAKLTWQKTGDTNGEPTDITAAKSFEMPDYDVTIAATFKKTEPAFVAVTDITGVPSTATAGTDLALTGTVAPEGATDKTITWSVKEAGETGATIQEGTSILKTTGAGTVKVTATIANGATASTAYTKDFEIKVSAAPEKKYTVSAAADSTNYLTFTPASAEAGTKVIVIVKNVPQGKMVDKVTVDPASVSVDTTVADSEYSFTMPDEDVTVSVTFKDAPAPTPDTYTVTADTNIKGAGKVTISPTEPVAEGTSVTVTAESTDPAKYEFVNWTTSDGLDKVELTKPSITFAMPPHNVELTANFKEIPPAPSEKFTITTKTAGKGSVSPETANVAKGGSQTFTFTPAEGWTLRKILLDGQSVTVDGDSYTVSDVQADMTLQAVFAESNPASPVVPDDVQEKIEEINNTIGEVKDAVEEKINSDTGKLPETEATVIAKIKQTADDAAAVLKKLDSLAQSATQEEAAQEIAEQVENLADTLATLDGLLYACPDIKEPQVEGSTDTTIAGLGLTAKATPGKVLKVSVEEKGKPAGRPDDVVKRIDFSLQDSDGKTVALSAPIIVTTSVEAGADIKWANHYHSTTNKPYPPIPATVSGTSAFFAMPSFSYVELAKNPVYPAPISPSRGSSGGGFTSYWITAKAGPNGAITPDGETKVGFGESLTVTVTPAEGYVVDRVVVDSTKTVTLKDGKYTFENVNEPYTIEATFKKSSGDTATADTSAPAAKPEPPAAVNPPTGDSWFSHLFDGFFR